MQHDWRSDGSQGVGPNVPASLLHPNVRHTESPVQPLPGEGTRAFGGNKYIPIPQTQLNGPSTWYLVPLAARLRGPLHLDALRVALLALEERHKPLRTTFIYRDGVDLQVIYDFVPKEPRVVRIPDSS
ncbi:Beauvericin nonribosomal cyclodepsipeptide synthetase BEA1 [Penicillium viridicatum]|nr:Beauvericin nonribosomal cyclodepsipeptide synthetase BEA1 [Penicillium viridicatum]